MEIHIVVGGNSITLWVALR